MFFYPVSLFVIPILYLPASKRDKELFYCIIAYSLIYLKGELNSKINLRSGI